MDNVSRERRSEIMRSIRGKDTAPELALRRLIFRLGYRYRLHAKDLPGSPDLVFRARRKVIFMHGCFWHGHHCRAGRHPKTRPAYWSERFAKNRRRDTKNVRVLRRLGWSVLTVWECQLLDPVRVATRVQEFLGPSGALTDR